MSIFLFISAFTHIFILTQCCEIFTALFLRELVIGMSSKKTSKAGLDFISKWEGVVLHPYLDVASLWTIGIGHLIKISDSFSTITNQQVKELLQSKDKNHPHSAIKISREEALTLLESDVASVENSLIQNVKVPLTQNQFDALISFGFNCGTGVFKTSGACKILNEGNYEEVPAKLLDWSKVRINGELRVNKGLLARRTAEGQLFSRKESLTLRPAGIQTLVSLNKENLVNIQTKLKNLGLYTGEVDGISGPLTKEAMRKFAEQKNLSSEVSDVGVTSSWLSALNES